jgi:hypothetical protein
MPKKNAAAERGKGEIIMTEDEPLLPIPVPKEKPLPSGGSFFTATSVVGLAVLLVPVAVGTSKFALNMDQETGIVTNLAVAALLFLAYVLGRFSVDNTRYVKPGHGKVTPAFIKEVKAIVGEKQVFDSGVEMSKHGRDQSFHERHPPNLVVYCLEVDEVQKVVQLCYAHRVPCTPRGAGTGLEGACIPYEGGVRAPTPIILWIRVCDLHTGETVGGTRPGEDEEDGDSQGRHAVRRRPGRHQADAR